MPLNKFTKNTNWKLYLQGEGRTTEIERRESSEFCFGKGISFVLGRIFQKLQKLLRIK